MKTFNAMTTGICLLIACTSNAQLRKEPLLMAVPQTYIHETGIAFPEKVDLFTRSKVLFLDNQNKHMRIEYMLGEGVNQTKISVFIYPCTQTSNVSLRKEYNLGLQSMVIAMDESLKFKFENSVFSKDGYTIRGLVAVTFDEQEGISVFQTGKWFLKFRVSAPNLSMNVFTSIQNQFLQILDPTVIVKKEPWDPSSFKILLDRKVLTDQDFATCVLLGTFAHALWMNKKVDSLERCSGVPGQYLQGYSGAFKLLLTGWDRIKDNKKKKSKFMQDMVELKLIHDNGYLEEYILSQVSYLLIVPEGEVIETDKYLEWANKNKISVNSVDLYYSVVYEK